MNSIFRTGTTSPLTSSQSFAKQNSTIPAQSVDFNAQATAQPSSDSLPADGPTPETYQQADLTQAPVFPTFLQQPVQVRNRANLESLFRVPLTLMPPGRQAELGQLAQQLGFNNLQSLIHSLRLLSPEAKNKLLEEVLKPQPLVVDSERQLASLFEHTFKESIHQLFAPPLQAPNFNADTHPQGMDAWNTAAYAAVFNGLKTIAVQDPQRFLTIAEAGVIDRNGQRGPLTFERAESPEVDENKAETFLDLMAQKVMIANTNEENGLITLFDNSFQRDTGAVTRQALTQLTMLSRFDTVSNQPIPEYRGTEAAERGLERLNGESKEAHVQRLLDLVSNRFVAEYGNNDWHRLQEAVNYIIRFKDLNNPDIVNKPIQEVAGNSQPRDPATLQALQRMGPDNISRVIARMEQVDAVSDFQRFLRSNHPGANALSADGMLGPETYEMVRSFQTSLALNLIKERLEDDGRLSAERKHELINTLNKQFTQLENHPDQARSVLQTAQTLVKTLIDETPNPLSIYTENQLQQDLPRFEQLVGGRFDSQTAEYLVESWFEMMDSGQGVDMAEQLVVHEAGHLWEHAIDTEGLRLEQNWARLFGAHAGTGEASENFYASHQQDFHDHLGHDNNSVSDYGATAAHEDFAEASRLFSYDPQRLMRRSLMKFLVMNHLNQGRISPENTLKMALESGYTADEVLSRLDSLRHQSPLTLGLARQLDQAYAPLRELATELAGQMPAAAFASQTDSTDLSPPLPTEMTGGWRFEQLVNQIRDIREISAHTPDTPQTPEQQAQLESLLQDFVRLAGASSETPQRAQEAFSRELDGFLTRLNTDRERRGAAPLDEAGARALVAGLALARAGVSDPASYTALNQHLPESFQDSFQELLKNPDLIAMLPQGSEFSPGQLLRGSLDQLIWIENTRAELNQNLSQISSELEIPQIAVADLPLPELASVNRPEPAQLMQSLAQPDVQAVFGEQDFNLELIEYNLNQALRQLGRLNGNTYTSVSRQDLQAFLLINRHQVITAELLNGFLAQRVEVDR